MRRQPFLILATLMLAAGCTLNGAIAPDDQVVLADLELPAAFEHVAREQGVPHELLLAIAWHNTSFEAVLEDGGHKGHEHASSHGWLGLTDAQTEQAAGLAGLPLEAVRNDPRVNLLAGAALLSELAGPGADPLRPTATWWPAVTALSDLSPSWLADEYALDVFTTLQDGLDVVTADGHAVTFAALDLPSLEDVELEEGPYEEPGDYHHGGVVGYPGRDRVLLAHSSNYSSYRPSSIRRVIIHTTEGSYASALSWFRNPSSNTAAHYVLRRSDGEITQMVPDNKQGWHACSANADTIGIEHEGRAHISSTWTDTNIEASARLSGWLAKKYNIPVDRTHFKGHGEVTPSYCPGRSDPGPYFPWARYLQKVKHYKQNGWKSGAFEKAEIDIRLPKNGQQVGNPFVMQIKHKHAKRLSVYIGARRVKKGLRNNPATTVIEPESSGWKRITVRAYKGDQKVGKKTIRVRVRGAKRDVNPMAGHIDGLDYLLHSGVTGGTVHHVRYWLNGERVRDEMTDKGRAKPDDFEMLHTFGNQKKKLLSARAYREDGKLLGEGWRWVKPENRPGDPIELTSISADELYGQTMRLHAAGDGEIAWVKYFVEGERVSDSVSGENLAYPPDFDMWVDFDEPGRNEVEVRAFDRAGNRRHTKTRNVHAPAFTLQMGWNRTGPRTYRFNADAPAGTDRVVFYDGSVLMTDLDSGDGFAPGRAFRLEHQFPSEGPATVSAAARDPMGNVLGSMTWTMDIE